MIDPGHPRLSIVRQCELASISRSSFYREPAVESEETLRLMRLLDEQFLETPWYGSRQMARHLRRNGWCVGRHRVRRLMLKMGLAPIYQRPKTSEPHPQHRTWPYLLRQLTSVVGLSTTTPIDPTRPSAAGRPTRSMLCRQTRSHLSQAAILSRQAGPPLLVVYLVRQATAKATYLRASKCVSNHRTFYRSRDSAKGSTFFACALLLTPRRGGVHIGIEIQQSP